MNKMLAAMAASLAIGWFQGALAEDADDRSAQPIRPPIVNYPAKAVQSGTFGKCSLTFDVSKRGKPENISAACTHRVFCRESASALKKVEFAPKVVAGQVVRRTGVVYPIEFSMQGANGKPQRADPDIPLQPCSANVPNS